MSHMTQGCNLLHDTDPSGLVKGKTMLVRLTRMIEVDLPNGLGQAA